jgi:hypothetical protein
MYSNHDLDSSVLKKARLIVAFQNISFTLDLQAVLLATSTSLSPACTMPGLPFFVFHHLNMATKPPKLIQLQYHAIH